MYSTELKFVVLTTDFWGESMNRSTYFNDSFLGLHVARCNFFEANQIFNGSFLKKENFCSESYGFLTTFIKGVFYIHNFFPWAKILEKQNFVFVSKLFYLRVSQTSCPKNFQLNCIQIPGKLLKRNRTISKLNYHPVCNSTHFIISVEVHWEKEEKGKIECSSQHIENEEKSNI